VINPNVDTEQAYILACKFVLPAGMVGLMVAAMASATASMATTRLNVFAGAFTETYQRMINKTATEEHLVFVGRIITVALGLVAMMGALLIPRYGYTKFIVDINTLLYVPLFLPSVWGLFSRKIGLTAVWVTTIAGFVSAYLVKFALSGDGFLAGVALLQPVIEWISENQRIADLLSGIVTPFLILIVWELVARKEDSGWAPVQEAKRAFHEQPVLKTYTLPGKMVAVSLAVIAVVMGALSFVDHEQAGILITMAAVLAGIGGTLYFFLRRADHLA
jgi:solute:Na+ symporter, SSS family